jgi:hypothetical protein
MAPKPAEGDYVLAAFPLSLHLIGTQAFLAVGEDRIRPAPVLGYYENGGKPIAVIGFQTTRPDCDKDHRHFIPMQGHISGLRPPSAGRGMPHLSRGIAVGIPLDSRSVFPYGTQPIGHVEDAFFDQIRQHDFLWPRSILVLPAEMRPGTVINEKTRNFAGRLRPRTHNRDFVPA